MGTLLNARGAAFQQCFDALNLNQPDLVSEIHREYVVAGSQIIQTNTFGANRFKLAAHKLESQVAEINRAGVELARQAALSADREIWIAGDAGPLGVRLAPYGRVQPDQARQAFAEQISALAEAGADLIILETFSDLNELCEALAAARQVCQLPVIASMTFTRDDRTLLGDAPARVAQMLFSQGADVIGVNCSGGPAQIWRILRQMRQALVGARADIRAGAQASPYFSVMPNAGWPEQVGGRIMYPANPDYFGEYALAFCEAGARIVGGCCGTTPQHIAAMRRAIDETPQGCGPSVAELSLPVESEEQAETATHSSRLAQKLFEGKFAVSVEMDPPRGLSTHKLLAGASLLAEAGADVINVADSPMARMRMSPWAVCDLVQRQVEVETVLHFPTRGRNLLRVQGDLLAAHALGIRNVFVVMGDPTAIGDYPDAMDNYDLVPSGLIKLIKCNFNEGLDHAGVDIGQPTSFFVGCALNLCPPDPAQEIKNLNRKLRAGADFLLTQPVYQPDIARTFINRYSDQFGPLPVPVLVGVLPLYGVRHATFLDNEVPGISISADYMNRLRAAGEKAPMEGVQIALELIEQMKPWASGIYLMPQFNRYDLAAEIIERCR
ncbi:MAG: methylenetetrahydrofolate reductase [Chloroflexi bacterium]|nr:methylenetetrahydrofolate reductase [Chloroflexota bacterium]